MNLDLLPEDLFSHMISFASPRDACCASLVSLMVRSSSDSDTVWQKFLPSDYEEILSRLAFPLPNYSSKKELFFRLLSPRLIDGGSKIFSLENSTGKKCYMLSARELSISWANNHLYWSWKPHSQSRFSEVAELRTICWLQIHGKFNTKMLSPKTMYGAYLIVKFAGRAYGLDTLPSQISLEVGNFKSQGKVYLRCQEKNKQACLLSRITTLRSRTHEEEEEEEEEEVALQEREDGWIEIGLGSFYNDCGDDKEVEMCLKEVTGEHLKGGLIVEGIELRPKKLMKV